MRMLVIHELIMISTANSSANAKAVSETRENSWVHSECDPVHGEIC